MISGVNHLTFAVSSLERSFVFYRDILGLKPLARWPRGAYLLAGEVWICLLEEKDVRPNILPEYTHVAFSVNPVDFDAASLKIRQSGATVWKENVSEGASLYFTDPDGHKFEIHASDWQSRLKHYKKNPPAGMEFF